MSSHWLYLNTPFLPNKHLPSGMLIGRKFWIEHDLQMDLRHMSGCIYSNGKRYSGLIRYQTASSDTVNAVIEDSEVDDTIINMDLSNFHNSPVVQNKLRSVLWKYREIFKGIGTVKNFEHEIRLQPDCKPYVAPMRRRSPKEQEIEKKAMKKLLEMGVLEPSESPWATNNVFVPKKDSGTRCTSDYRVLNSFTIGDQYPMEGVKETLDWLGTKKYFSLFDLKDSFYQVLLAKNSRAFTAVRTVLGLLQYTRLPQGMKSSAAVLQRIVNQVLAKCKGQSVWAYMDDGTIGSETAEKHVQHVSEVLDCLLGAVMR